VKIPRFWSAAEGEVEVRGSPRVFRAFGWSEASPSEAQALARERLARVLDRVRRGEDLPRGYDYGDRPLREEIVRELPGEQGPAALVTRNRHGALVLNAARALFIDVDLPAPRSRGALGWLLRRPKDDPEPAVLERIRSALRGAAGSSFRIYRTAAGFRVLATDPPFEPGSARASQLFETAGADPRFVRLCAAQQSFRARLTPKPHRCGVHRRPPAFPREDGAGARAFAEWLRAYDAASARYAVCRLVETAGFGRVNDEIAPLLALHDAETKVGSDLPLA
jgi:hypothetical protein